MSEESAETAADPGLLSRHLPEIFSTSEFLRNFLRYYDELVFDIAERTDQLHRYFDPATAPVHMLDWLGDWVGVELDPSFPEPSWRSLLKAAICRSSRRGTALAMQEAIEAALCLSPGSVRVIDGPVERYKDLEPFHFVIEIDLSHPSPEAAKSLEPGQVEPLRRRVLSIVETEKPAHVFLKDVKFHSPVSDRSV